MVSDYELNAYVDGELTGDERAEFAKQLLASDTSSDQVSAARSLTQLIRLAYSKPPTLDDLR